MAFALRSSVSARSVVKGTKARAQVQARAASRPLWYPGNKAPSWLKGELAGDYGFDPLGLGSDEKILSWFVQAELQNARWAMLGVTGILFTSLGQKAGLGFPDWWDAGAECAKSSPIPMSTLIAIEFLLFGWVEHKRLYDWITPGSQNPEWAAFGLKDAFKGKENGYPGGIFDPFGFSRGDQAKYREYKEKEIKNGRLAMVAFVGFLSQHFATGKSPIDNLVDHVSDPTHVTFATNGISVPHFTEFA